MKSLMLIMLLLAALSGCASRHYVEQKTDSLVFSLQLAKATRVQFSSSTDNFVLHDTVKNSSGIWQLTVPLRSELKYFYIVDGSVYLPECRLKETDDFGSENCLYQP
ncbi:MAG: hypothetical protein BA862_00795 [Desulfobulbaceae bacterium S3730MH12]|nr:MAG: hypothetical protein BA866_10800 [Desulfobulbaceae bacterium S5133MH15]OEU54628.1 MAG: hypothetical protein BA862_00795 [Desulfobulbaceae bacterium S3730MH12]OEU78408.1 MAG: hypothetical protein BA873_04235 [Desulfobulbaceae bacterium C00003063]